jgi:hypothetical protein
MDTRKISPHKGGRTAHFPRSRITEDARKKLDLILQKRKISAADWVIEKIDQEYKALSDKE